MSDTSKKKIPSNAKPISLYPLSLEEAMKKMLDAKPSAKPVIQRRKPSKRA
jgi:hypothetical protein